MVIKSTKTTTVRYQVQSWYKSGTHDDPVWVWLPYTEPLIDIENARAALERFKPTAFNTKARPVKLTTTVETEELE